MNTVNCEVNVFVAATQISGPACMYTPAPHSRAMVLATLLQIASVRWPFLKLSRTAASVSMVSPLWLTAKTSVSLSIGMLR